jgi:hypothetical protein
MLAIKALKNQDAFCEAIGGPHRFEGNALSPLRAGSRAEIPSGRIPFSGQSTTAGPSTSVS